MNHTVKAVVATIQLGLTSFEGLMLPNGDYAIAVSQLVDLNLVPPNRSIKQLESLIGITFQSHQKAKTEINPKPVNIIGLKDFGILLAKLDRAGHIPAQELRDSLGDLSLHQLFCDGFGVKCDADDRQQQLIKRMQGKQKRLSLTDATKLYIERHQLPEQETRYLYAKISDLLNTLLFGATAKELRAEYGCPNHKLLRDEFDAKDLDAIKDRESHAAQLISKYDIHPVAAINQAHDFWLSSL